MKATVSNNTEDQLPEETNDDAQNWEYVFDDMDGADNPLDVPDRHLVHQFRLDDDPGPPDLCKPPSKQAQVKEDNEDSPPWPASGRFTEQYLGIAATILGREKMIFECLKAAEDERGDGKWAPFHDEDEWELARFLMKNLGQTKIDEFLKLPSVSE